MYTVIFIQYNVKIEFFNQDKDTDTTENYS